MNRHIPVLLGEVIEVLQPQKGEKFADLTAGYGGHSKALLQAVGQSGYGYLFDRDLLAVKALKSRFTDTHNLEIAQANFADVAHEQKLSGIDMVLADLGVSSPQLDEYQRGFSFQTDGPLDMRMDTTQELSAYEIVNTYSEKDLADILYGYGQERQSRRIAHAIVQARKTHSINTTAQLSEIISQTVSKTGKIHPATLSFQAIRIATNQELTNLQMLLNDIPEQLKPGARLAIISFHSLEDRMVKQAFAGLCKSLKDEFGQTVSEPQYRKVTKKPIQGKQFDISNPRARSAKLRAVEKIN